MKIEKVNENQIRCTLTKQDLADRQINLRELAYGSEKAKGLFHDMIQQANYEFGFDVSDNPLMVEAIPLSSESLVLLITKVEYPEELDTRFSQFTEAGDEELFSNMGAVGNVERKGADDILELFQKIREAKASPESENAQQTEAPEEIPEVPADLTKMFEFTTIDQEERLAHVLVNYYNGRNDLFKNEKKNRFYLVIHKDDHTPEELIKSAILFANMHSRKTIILQSEHISRSMEIKLRDRRHCRCLHLFRKFKSKRSAEIQHSFLIREIYAVASCSMKSLISFTRSSGSIP